MGRNKLVIGRVVFGGIVKGTIVQQGAQNIFGVQLRSVQRGALGTGDWGFALSQLIRQAFAAHAAVGSERVYWQQQFELELEAASDNEKKKHVVTLLARGTHLSVEIGRAHV